MELSNVLCGEIVLLSQAKDENHITRRRGENNDLDKKLCLILLILLILSRVVVFSLRFSQRSLRPLR